MMRLVILASAAFFAIAESAHAREWYIYNFESLQCENQTGSLASPDAKHQELRKLGMVDSVEVVKDPKTNEVMAAMIQVELPHSRSPSGWIWFTSKELCEKAAIKLGPKKEDIE